MYTFNLKLKLLFYIIAYARMYIKYRKKFMYNLYSFLKRSKTGYKGGIA